MASAEEVDDLSQYIISPHIDINPLDCKTAFSGLTEKEKLYAHYLCRAAWEGSLICLLQTSPESPAIFLLLQHLFHAETVEELKERTLGSEDGPSKEEFEVGYKKKIIVRINALVICFPHPPTPGDSGNIWGNV